jgi:hypothetical protein
MTALHDFIRASASYFGLPLDQLTEGSTLDTTRGDMEVVLRVALMPSDVAEIAERMQRMALEAAVDAQVARQQAEAEVAATPSREAMREVWNMLHPSLQSRYGSFHRYVASVEAGMVPTTEKPTAPPDLGPGPEDEPVTIPTVVWVHPSAATEQQKMMAIGVNEHGYIGLDPADLTPEQAAMSLYPANPE